MQLHRADKQPEWADVPTAQQNMWQRIATATHGVLTPANVITWVGLLIVFFGLQQIIADHYWAGFIALIVGRLLDIVDGMVADYTGTKGPLGELMDASADKLGTFATIIAFIYAHTAAYWLLAVVVLPQLITSAIVLLTVARHKRFHPSRIGKLSMAAAWISLPGFVLVKALGLRSTAAFSMVVTAITLLSGLLALYATVGYLRDARNLR